MPVCPAALGMPDGHPGRFPRGRAGGHDVDVVLHPPQQRPVDLPVGPSWDLRHHGVALPVVHQEPRVGGRPLAPAGLFSQHLKADEAEIPITVPQTTLFDPVTDHDQFAAWQSDGILGYAVARSSSTGASATLVAR